MNVRKVRKLYDDHEILRDHIIDVRDKRETWDGKIAGSRNVPMNSLLGRPDKYLDKKEEYYITCQSGSRSLATVINLKFKGYKIHNISGGYNAWKELNK